MAKAPKIIPQPHWDKLSPMDKIKWYVDAAATPRYPLFESLLRDAGMPERVPIRPRSLGKFLVAQDERYSTGVQRAWSLVISRAALGTLPRMVGRSQKVNLVPWFRT